jgi:predicted transcriptional regulator
MVNSDIDELISMIRKKGFRDTYQVLSQYKNKKIDKHTFYNELNKFSYYNSFFRIKDELLEKGLIRIEKKEDRKFIRLTEKGLELYDKLVEMNQLINK